ncbi:hypothetical protein [Flavobacterium sp.]|uniref:hypothetical protein n=1 Tax=Flavobacterium sp. TaxID=239 RepID=UPI0037535023
MESYSTQEILSVYTPPYKLNFTDYINCPICEIEIDIFNIIVDENTFIRCEDCEHTIQFKLVKF